MDHAGARRCRDADRWEALALSGPDQAVALTRTAVRDVLAVLDPGDRVVVGCSGGADSLALGAALAFEAPKLAIVPIGVVVDHGLQAGSAAVAERAAQQCRSLGIEQVQVIRVEVPSTGDGPESSARSARYAALEEAVHRHGAARLLVGHTRDDQAEQVLLGLARGSGARSLSGMARARGMLLRPFIGISRADTEAACAAYGIEPWHDPHNADDRYARVRARSVLAVMEQQLGPGIGAALARSAEMLREDADLLDELSVSAAHDLGAGPFPVADLAALPRPIRTRVWRILARGAGVPSGSMTNAHVESLDALLTSWHGQGPMYLPGGVLASRSGGNIALGAALG